jgi:hypothetical protein
MKQEAEWGVRAGGGTMRMIGLVVVLAVVIALGYAVYMAVSSGTSRPQAVLESRAKWRVRHYGEPDVRVVAVSLILPNGRVLDEHVVDRIADRDPAWEEQFLRAIQTAEERAFHLNATRPEDDNRRS